MVSEIQILRWCDVCAEAGKRVEAEQLSTHPAGMKIDLCNEHRTAFDDVADLLAAYGYRETSAGVAAAPAKRETARAGRRTTTQLTDADAQVCPECLVPFSGTNGLSTLRNHMKAIHGIKSSEYTADELKQAAAEAKSRALARQRAS